MDMMLRRRAMMGMVQSPIIRTPIYELAAPTNVAEYDTEVKLFDPAFSFTILCNATFANRSWTGSQTILGIGTNAIFRVGTVGNYYEYQNDVSVGQQSRRYTALVANPTTSGRKMSSLFGRKSNNSSQTSNFAVRYDHIAAKVEGFTAADTRRAPTIAWWTLGSNYSGEETLKLNLGSSGSTVNVLKIYDVLLTDEEINAFLDS